MEKKVLKDFNKKNSLQSITSLTVVYHLSIDAKCSPIEYTYTNCDDCYRIVYGKTMTDPIEIPIGLWDAFKYDWNCPSSF